MMFFSQLNDSGKFLGSDISLEALHTSVAHTYAHLHTRKLPRTCVFSWLTIHRWKAVPFEQFESAKRLTDLIILTQMLDITESTQSFWTGSGYAPATLLEEKSLESICALLYLCFH